MWEYNKGFIIISAVHNGTRNGISTRRTLEAFCLSDPRNCRLYRLLFFPRPRISKKRFPFRSRNFHYSLRLLPLTATSIARRVRRYRSPRMPLFLLSLADNHLRRLSLSLFHTHTHSLAPHTRPSCMDIRPRMSSSSHSSSESSLILSVHGFM